MSSTANVPNVPRPHRGKALKSGNPEWATCSPRERAAMALLLRHDGWTWQRISDYLGYAGRAAAHTAAMKLAVKIAPPTPEQREAERQKDLARLAQLWAVIEPNLGSDDAERRDHAIHQAQRVIDSYVLLLGVPATQTPPASRLARYGLGLVTVTEARP